jgi:YVTN family beta-propeller protein
VRSAAALALSVVAAGANAAGPPVTIGVGATPMSLLAVGDTVWVANKDGGTVSRIDTGADHVSATIRVGGQPWGLASDGRSVWVGNYAEGAISRIDVASNRVVSRIRVGKAPIALDYGRGTLWAADYSAGRLFRVDPARGAVTGRFTLPGNHLDVLVRPSGIWVASEDGVTRVNARSGRVEARIQGGADTTFITPCAGALWASNFMGSALWRIDERRARVTARVAVGNAAAGIACLKGSVWVARYYANRLLRISPSGAVVRRLVTGASPTDVVATANAVWVANSGDGSVTKYRS